MVRNFLIAIIFAICITGCGPDTQSKEHQSWEIQIIDPQGEVFETHVVRSVNKPSPSAKYGGQIGFIDRGCVGYKDWERDVITPVGWGYKIERAEEDNLQ